MKIDYFKAAENEISSLPVLIKSVEFMERRRQDLVECGKPPLPGAIDFSKPYADTQHINDTLNDALSLAELSIEIKKTKAEIKHIESVLSELPEEHKKVLKLYYIEQMSAERITKEIYVESEKTVYNMRNRGIMNYILLSFGAAAAQ